MTYPGELQVDPVGQLRKEMGTNGWFHRLQRKWNERTRRIRRERELREAAPRVIEAPHEYNVDAAEERMWLYVIGIVFSFFCMAVIAAYV